MIFIRFNGCNLDCSFCDEKNKNHTSLKWQNIIETVRSFPCRNILLTGGEPLFQKNITGLIDSFIAAGYRIYIETNGTQTISLSPQNEKKIWFTVSPKEINTTIRASEYKFLYDEFSPHIYQLWGKVQPNLENWKKSCPHLFLQPVHYGHHSEKTIINLKKAVQIVQSHASLLRLSVQTHKYIGIE